MLCYIFRNILNYLVSEGILSVPITEVHSQTHDHSLELLYDCKFVDGISRFDKEGSDGRSKRANRKLSTQT